MKPTKQKRKAVICLLVVPMLIAMLALPVFAASKSVSLSNGKTSAYSDNVDGTGARINLVNYSTSTATVTARIQYSNGDGWENIGRKVTVLPGADGGRSESNGTGLYRAYIYKDSLLGTPRAYATITAK